MPGLVSEVVPTRRNGGGSFFIAPDGSQEGWEESDRGDQQRDVFVRWLKTQREGDGSSWFAWRAISYTYCDGRTHDGYRGGAQKNGLRVRDSGRS